MDSRSNHRPRKLKVKSGCHTCKIRKVKCDEGRPACHRCLSTGRICDGYGIWGGGNNIRGHQQCPAGLTHSHVITGPPPSPFALVSGTKENEYFDWFKCRTATKLQGSFTSSFWDTLLFQASLSEPAVWHGVLALSSLHKTMIVNANIQRNSDSIPDEQERFTLQNYGKSISCLQPHFSAKNTESFRVALITCVVFVCLDFLRGHFQAAQIHLQNGLKILTDMKLLSKGNNGIFRLKPCNKTVDELIIRAFSRLHLQVELFKHGYQHPSLILQIDEPDIPTVVFYSINEAWQQMERLFNNIFHLRHQALQQAASGSGSLPRPLEMREHQQRIQIELVQWLDMYNAFFTRLYGQTFRDKQRHYRLLCAYHTMASIMVDICLQPNDESVFDSNTSQFILLVEHLGHMWTVSSLATTFPALPGHFMDMSRSIIDMGWIPPLYYTAVKCRNHRVRLHAIRLLEAAAHREGIWDGETTACVARKVMEIEERDFYNDIDVDDEFSLDSSPRPQDLALPNLPKSYRIREVEVVLSGAPMNRFLLFCKKKHGGKNHRVLLSEYNVHSQRWEDGKHR